MTICKLKSEDKIESKKMDVNPELHSEINSLQAELYNKYRVKVRIQDITNEAIVNGLPLAKKNIIKELKENLIITPVEED